MNLLKNVLEFVPRLLEEPYKVKQASPDLVKSELLMSEGPLSLYKTGHNLNIFLQIRSDTFQLCHLPLSMKQDAKYLFNQYKEKLLIFIKTFLEYKAKILPVLAKICNTIRNSHTSLSYVHLAVKSELCGLYSKVELKPWIDAKDFESEETPLHLAIRINQENIALELIKAGASLNLTNKLKETVIHTAVKYEQLNVLKEICKRIQNLNSYINLLNFQGESALQIACKLGNEEACKILIEFNADILSKGKVAYALHYALKYKHTSIINLILKENRGSVYLACEKHGGLPLHWCKTQSHAQLLVEHGTPLNHPSNTGDHPIHIMSQKGRLDVAIALVHKNVDVNAKGRMGNTPLHVAAGECQVDLVKMLLLFGANQNLTNDFNDTPYLIALRGNKSDKNQILEMLAPSQITKEAKLKFGFVNQPLNMISSQENFFKRPKLLCLDGGGIRGLVLTQILIEIEKQTGKKIKDLFDWISGTSTGGILAIALAQGKSAIDCQRLYLNMKDKIFVGSRPYEVETLEKFLKETFGEDTTMESLKDGPKLIIPTTLADRKPPQLHLFTNYSVDDPNKFAASSQYQLSKSLSEYDKRLLASNLSSESDHLWKVARCTSAAPTYFKSYDSYVDGGLFANNPTLDAMTEIHHYYRSASTSLSQFNKLGLVVSLGTGQSPTSKTQFIDLNWSGNIIEKSKSLYGANEWKNMIVDIITESNSHVIERARAWCESMDAYYFRLNPFLDEALTLDETDDKKLVDLMWNTQNYVAKNMSTIKEIIYLLSK